MALYVGTSGWAYREWQAKKGTPTDPGKPAFYPADLPRRRFLEHYASVFGACEINASFYQLQDEDTFRRWRAETPEPFRFAIKAHRRLTHFRRAGPIAERLSFLPGFLASLVPLGDRMGPVLFQFPPTTPRDDDLLAQLLDALPHHHDYTFEFREPSWNVPGVTALLEGRGATLCVSGTDSQPPDSLPPGRVAYVRLRADHYSARRRARWRALLEHEAENRDVYVFAKHEGTPAGDPFAGVGLAQWLARNRRRSTL